MRASCTVLVAAVLSMGCGASAEKVAGAAVTTGIALAAAGVHRATTGGCYAECRHGFRCDEDSGQCLPIACSGGCPPNQECRTIGGELACVPLQRELPAERPNPASAGGAGGEGTRGGAGGEGGAIPIAEEDPCRDLCFTGERCVVVDGVADCVRGRD